MPVSPFQDSGPRCKGCRWAQWAGWAHTVDAVCSQSLLCDQQTEAGWGREACRRWLCHCWWLWRFGFGMWHRGTWDRCWLCAPGFWRTRCTSEKKKTIDVSREINGSAKKVSESEETCLFFLTSIRSEAVCRISSTSRIACFVEIDVLIKTPLDESDMQPFEAATTFLMFSPVSESNSISCVMSALLVVKS